MSELTFFAFRLTVKREIKRDVSLQNIQMKYEESNSEAEFNGICLCFEIVSHGCGVCRDTPFHMAIFANVSR
jgi:hypothetical protein